MAGFLFFLVYKFLSLVFIPLPILFRLLLELFLLLTAHLLPENAYLFHYLTWVPLRMYSLQFFPFFLTEKYVRWQRSPGSFINRSGRSHTLLVIVEFSQLFLVFVDSLLFIRILWLLLTLHLFFLFVLSDPLILRLLASFTVLFFSFFWQITTTFIFVYFSWRFLCIYVVEQ